MRNSRYEDFKYVIQDITKVYIGAKYTYGELQACDEAPFKLRAIISQYILKEADPGMTIAQHLLSLKETDLSYLVFRQMKVQCKVYEWKAADGGRRRQEGYESRSYAVDEMISNEAWRRDPDKVILEEISFKKLAMMAVSL